MSFTETVDSFILFNKSLDSCEPPPPKNLISAIFPQETENQKTETENHIFNAIIIYHDVNSLFITS